MPQPIEIRVQLLEERVTSLEELPPRMAGLELQIVQLRTEMHAEFSAVRGEIRLVDVRLGSVEAGLREEIRSLGTGLREEIHSVETGLRLAIDEAQVQTRVLFEDFVARLAVVDEGKNVPPPQTQAEALARRVDDGPEHGDGYGLKGLSQEDPGRVAGPSRPDLGAGELVAERAIRERRRQQHAGRLPALAADRRGTFPRERVAQPWRGEYGDIIGAGVPPRDSCERDRTARDGDFRGERQVPSAQEDTGQLATQAKTDRRDEELDPAVGPLAQPLGYQVRALPGTAREKAVDLGQQTRAVLEVDGSAVVGVDEAQVP